MTKKSLQTAQHNQMGKIGFSNTSKVSEKIEVTQVQKTSTVETTGNLNYYKMKHTAESLTKNIKYKDFKDSEVIPESQKNQNNKILKLKIIAYLGEQEWSEVVDIHEDRQISDLLSVLSDALSEDFPNVNYEDLRVMVRGKILNNGSTFVQVGVKTGDKIQALTQNNEFDGVKSSRSKNVVSAPTEQASYSRLAPEALIPLLRKEGYFSEPSTFKMTMMTEYELQNVD